MLLVKSYVAPSPIHGLGLFAAEPIMKGTEIWRFTPTFDLKLTREQILALPKLAQIFIYKYSFRSKKSLDYILCSDDGKYFNHSELPNCVSTYTDSEPEVVTVALHDIEVSEELTDNYNSFEFEVSDGDVLDEIAAKYQLKDELDPRFKKIV